MICEISQKAIFKMLKGNGIVSLFLKSFFDIYFSLVGNSIAI